MDLHELETKTVNDLREMAAKYEDIKGVSGLKKDQLIDILCEKLGIDQHVHVPTGIGRRKIKARIRALRKKRDEALQAHDAAALADVRGEIKSNRRKLKRLITHAVHEGEQKPSAPSQSQQAEQPQS